MNKQTEVIAIVNQKGGVGKTTTTANLAYSLAELGRDVLVIDFDSQASLTHYLNVGTRNEEAYYGIYELLVKNLGDPNYTDDEIEEATWTEMFEKCICRPTYRGRIDKKDAEIPFGFDLIPSSLALSDYDFWVSRGGMNREAISELKMLIRKITAYHPYDYVLIDCSPYLGVMTMNAIVAASSGCLIPTNLDLMSTRGVVNLIDVINSVQEQVMYIKNRAGEVIGETDEIHYGVVGVVLNLYREGRLVDVTIQSDLTRYYPFRIFENTIPESVNAKKAVMGGMLYAQVYGKAKTAYHKLAKEVEKQVKDMKDSFKKSGYDKETLIKHLGETPESELTEVGVDDAD